MRQRRHGLRTVALGALLAGAISLGVSGARADGPFTVTVPATTTPPGTAVTLTQGDTYRITAIITPNTASAINPTCDVNANSGNGAGSTCQTGPAGANNPGFGNCGTDPEGNTCEVPGALFGRLVGRFGTSADNNNGRTATTSNGTATDYVDIGAGPTTLTASAGTLYLVFNDYTGPRTSGTAGNDYYQDNAGSYQVTITDIMTNGTGPGSGPGGAATPEAPAGLLFAVGMVPLAALVAWRRRRRPQADR